MERTVVIVALALLGVAAISRRLTGTPVTAAMVFVAFGLVVGPHALGGSISRAPARPYARWPRRPHLVLFSDASRVDPRHLRPDVGVRCACSASAFPYTIRSRSHRRRP